MQSLGINFASVYILEIAYIKQCASEKKSCRLTTEAQWNIQTKYIPYVNFFGMPKLLKKLIEYVYIRMIWKAVQILKSIVIVSL